MKRILTIFVFLIFKVAVLAQASFGIKINGGVSKFYDNMYNHTFGTQTSYFMPSGQAGIFFNLPVRTHEVFGIELLFTQITGKEKEVDTIGTYSSYGNTTKLISTNNLSRNISYLSLPIYYGIKIKKLTIKVGLQVSARLMSSGQSVTQGNFDAQGNLVPFGTYTSTLKTNKLYIKDGAFGQTAAITYNLTPKFSLEANYYYELSNIYRKPYISGIETIWKFQQITLGLRYAFLTIKKKEIKS
jgi:hypothetical protein